MFTCRVSILSCCCSSGLGSPRRIFLTEGPSSCKLLACEEGTTTQSRSRSRSLSRSRYGSPLKIIITRLISKRFRTQSNFFNLGISLSLYYGSFGRTLSFHSRNVAQALWMYQAIWDLRSTSKAFNSGYRLCEPSTS